MPNQIVKFIRIENKFEISWKYECSPIPDASLEAIAWILFSDQSGFWLGEVDQWIDVKAIVDKSISRKWVFNFSRGRGFASHANDLELLCDRPLSDNDLFKINGYFYSGSKAPEADLDEKFLALDLVEAREAVANYYRVESRQVEILIKSN